MAKTRAKHSHSSSKSQTKPDSILHTPSAHVKSPTKPSSTQQPIESLLEQAATLLEQSQPEIALPLAEEALTRLENEQTPPSQPDEAHTDKLLRLATQGHATLPQTLVIAAEIHLALGDPSAAHALFSRAVQLDPDGALISAEPLLYLAQLSEAGGQESIAFFERGCQVLRNEIEVLSESLRDDGDDVEGRLVLGEKQAKLADALCGMAEVYMTDLSWEGDAESNCEAYVTEAVAVCPERRSAGVLQVLGSVRISQERIEDAREALRRSMAVWKGVGEEDDEEGRRPDFATRVSLARLLMEVAMESEALEVLEGLVREDDESVETLYLGGWCQYLMAQKRQGDMGRKDRARTWLGNCLKQFRVQEYGDEKLREHAVELKGELDKQLGVEDEEEGDDDDDDDAWEDEDEELEVEEEINGHRVRGGDADGDVNMT